MSTDTSMKRLIAEDPKYVHDMLKVLPLSTEMPYREVKYQVTEAVNFKLHYDYGLPDGFAWFHPKGWYGIYHGFDRDFYVVAFTGCTHDGATKYPDYRWMLAPSLLHDILHWLLKRGIIDYHYNDVIDLELKMAIIHGKEPIPWWQGGNSEFTRGVRAHLILRGTNIVDEEVDTETPDVEIKKVLI